MKVAEEQTILKKQKLKEERLERLEELKEERLEEERQEERLEERQERLKEERDLLVGNVNCILFI